MARVNVLEESIDSFLSPKPYLGYLFGNCCCSHTLPDRVLQQFGSTAGYSFHSQAKQVTPSASVEERGHGEDEDDAAISALLAL